ncbi:MULTISPECIES: hypothetical protein [Psychrobacter]|uniref:hypothetical protein n=1 Tax=Psychrobacter TaxID=497 RepID=UPI000EE5EDC9|nr:MULTISPECIES: hypothetical protein [Psychrobacter]HCR88274.1 hypothetical protein [Psychrobacter sp.]
MRMLWLTPILFLSFSTAAYSDAGIEEYCFEASQLSRHVMTSRQLGDPIENALAVRDRAFEKSKDESSRKVHTEIILEAYSSPAYSTESFIQSEIDEFTAKNYIACIQAMRLAKKHGKLK